MIGDGYTKCGVITVKQYKPFSQQEKELRREEQKRREWYESLPTWLKVIPVAISGAARSAAGPAGGGHRH